jgi:hypothetical protein
MRLLAQSNPEEFSMPGFAIFRCACLAAAIFAASLLLPLKLGTTSAGPKARQGARAHININKIAPRAEDVSSIDGILKAYYEVVSGPAGQPRQWDRDATLYIPEVRFVVITEDKDGNATAVSMTHQDFVDSFESAMPGKPFFERSSHHVIRRAGNIAHVVSAAEQATSLDGPYKFGGMDSLELFFDGKRWWIAGANLWEVNVKAHPVPAEFLSP